MGTKEKDAIKRYLLNKYKYQISISEYRRAIETERQLKDLEEERNLEQFEELFKNLNISNMKEK